MSLWVHQYFMASNKLWRDRKQVFLIDSLLVHRHDLNSQGDETPKPALSEGDLGTPFFIYFLFVYKREGGRSLDIGILSQCFFR